MQKNLVVSVFGPIGAGKEGVCITLQKHFGLVMVSMSGAIREKQQDDLNYAQRFPRRIGQNYPFEAAELAFNAFIDRYGVQNTGFVIDGVPRGTPEQVEMVLNRFSPVDYDVIFLHLTCPREKCAERARGRSESRRNQGLPEREDDKPEYIRDRLDEHFSEVHALLDAIGQYGGNLIEVNAEPPQADVLQEVISRVKLAVAVHVTA